MTFAWNIGDVALCLDDSDPSDMRSHERNDLIAGRSYFVSRIVQNRHGTGLHLCGMDAPRHAGFSADRFLKVEMIAPLTIEQKETVYGIA